MPGTSSSYVDAAYADSYFAVYGNAEWTELNNEQKDAALASATQFIDNIARGKWKGKKTDPAQALAWPRTGSTDEDGAQIGADVIPDAVKNAVCEAAVRISQGEDLMEDTTPAVASESVAGAVSISYFGGVDNVTSYRKIYSLLYGLVTTELGDSQKSGSVRVVRG